MLHQLYHHDGLSLRRLAARFAVSPQAVRGWLVAAGIPRRPPAGAEPTDPSTLIALYAEGWSGPELARRFGCSATTVYHRLERAGVARRRDRRALRRPELVEALDAGLSAPQMAARFAVSVSAVCRALAREGLETSSQAAKRRARQRYADLVEAAGRSGTVAAAALPHWRRPVGPR